MLSPKITFSQLYAHHLFGIPLPKGEGVYAYCRECGGIIDGGSEISYRTLEKSDKWTYEDSLWYKNSWVICPACYTLRQPVGEYSPVRHFFPVNEKTGEIDKKINSNMRTKLCLKNREGLLVHREGILLGRVTLADLVDFAQQRNQEVRNGGGDAQNRQEGGQGRRAGAGTRQNPAEELPMDFEIFELLEADKVVPPFACVIGQEIWDVKKIGYFFWNVPLNWSTGQVVTFYLLGTQKSVAVNVRWLVVKRICEEVAAEYPGLFISIRSGQKSPLFAEEARKRGLVYNQALSEAREKALSYQYITPEEKKVLAGLFRIKE